MSIKFKNGATRLNFSSSRNISAIQGHIRGQIPKERRKTGDRQEKATGRATKSLSRSVQKRLGSVQKSRNNTKYSIIPLLICINDR